MQFMADKIHEFGPFTFDSQDMLLRKNGTFIAIGQRAAILLDQLLTAAGKPVSKAELMDAAWTGKIIEESNLTVQIASLRKSLGRTKEGNEWIVTVQRVGYQFNHSSRTRAGSPVTALNQYSLASLDKASVVVLPFSNLSSDAQYGYFADAMTEDIIAALSRVREFFVLSRTTSFSYKQRSIGARDVAQELGVKYLLEGSVQVVGLRLRVTAQLIDGQTGGHIWAERFEREIADIFSVQDEISRCIAVAMQVKLSYGDLAALWEGQTRNLRAWEKMAQGREFFLRFDRIGILHAQVALTEALQIDPSYTGAMVQLALCYWWQARFDTSVPKEISLQLCEQHVHHALAVDPKMGSAFMLLGGNAFLRDQHDEAMEYCEKAIELAPNDSWAMAFLGLVCTYGGKTERAVEVLKTALRLSPRPPAWYLESYGLAHLWFGDYATAQNAFAEQLQIYPDDADALMHAATAYGFQGRMDDARRVVSTLRTKQPTYCLKVVMRTERYKEREQIEKVIAILRDAGLPE
jgi:TolB-like protein/cytochrome c-type biogenesis protein CcmH/NrfG